MALHWQQIREACEAAGLPIREWEHDLPDKMLRYFIDRVPHGVERYATDHNFYSQVTKLVGLVLGCVLDRDPLSDPSFRDRSEELGGIFRSEADTARE